MKQSTSSSSLFKLLLASIALLSVSFPTNMFCQATDKESNGLPTTTPSQRTRNLRQRSTITPSITILPAYPTQSLAPSWAPTSSQAPTSSRAPSSAPSISPSEVPTNDLTTSSSEEEDLRADDTHIGDDGTHVTMGEECGIKPVPGSTVSGETTTTYYYCPSGKQCCNSSCNHCVSEGQGCTLNVCDLYYGF